MPTVVMSMTAKEYNLKETLATIRQHVHQLLVGSRDGSLGCSELQRVEVHVLPHTPTVSTDMKAYF
jgi:hypothetical protein